MGTGEFNAGGNPAMDWHPIQGGVEILLVAHATETGYKRRPDGPSRLVADFSYSSNNYSRSTKSNCSSGQL